MNNPPLYSVCQATIPDPTFEEALELVVKSGANGIGITEDKIRPGEEEKQIESLQASGLKAAGCLPTNVAPLPLRPPVMYPGPEDPEKRIALMRESIERLAPFQPDCFVITTGSSEGYSTRDAWRVAADGIRDIARATADLDVRLAVELVRSDGGFDATFLRTLQETAEFLDLVGEDNVGLCYDVYHVWDSPNLLELTEELAPRTFNVQISDWREPARSLADRLIPGDGIIDLPGIFGALERGGYDGWYDLEIFSDDGRWGNEFPDSLWKLPVEELLTRSHDAFEELWQKRRS